MLEIGAETCGVAIGLPPNNAPKPRPKAGFAIRLECRRAGEMSKDKRWFGFQHFSVSAFVPNGPVLAQCRHQAEEVALEAEGNIFTQIRIGH